MHGASILKKYSYIFSAGFISPNFTSIIFIVISRYIISFDTKKFHPRVSKWRKQLSQLRLYLLDRPSFLIDISTNKDLVLDNLVSFLRSLRTRKIRTRSRTLNKQDKINIKNFNNDTHFGFCLLFFIYMEMFYIYMLEEIETLTDYIVKFQYPIFDFTKYIFIARYAELGKYDREIEAELDKCNFNPQQKEFIWKWVRKEIDLVRNES